MNALAIAPPREIELFEPPLDALYTIEATAHIVDVPRRAIVHYYKRGLVSPALDPRRGYYFDRDGIRRLRQIEGLRPLCQDTLDSIKMILALMDEVERLHSTSFSHAQSANGKQRKRNSTNKEKEDGNKQ